MSLIGQARNVLIGGRAVPGIVISEATEHTVEVPSKDPARKGAMVKIPVQRADIITLRETNPALGAVRQYHTITSENLRFTTPRFTTVVGLDVEKKGGKSLSFEALVALTEASMAEFQASRLTAQAEPEVAL